MIDLKSRPRDELDHMNNAAQIVLETMRVFQKSKTSITKEIINTVDRFDEIKHYPKRAVYDGESHCSYYYIKNEKKVSEADLQNTEHGHFHTFIHGRALKKLNIEPAPVVDFTPDMDITDIKAHLIGIGMNHFGVPVRLFTVNRWVTKDTWHTADNLINSLNSFEIDQVQPSWALNLWISHMMILFRPQIETLLIQRDEKISQWANKYKSENVFKDEKLRAISYVNIDIEQQIKAIESAI